MRSSVVAARASLYSRTQWNRAVALPLSFKAVTPISPLVFPGRSSYLSFRILGFSLKYRQTLVISETHLSESAESGLEAEHSSIDFAENGAAQLTNFANGKEIYGRSNENIEKNDCTHTEKFAQDNRWCEEEERRICVCILTSMKQLWKNRRSNSWQSWKSEARLHCQLCLNNSFNSLKELSASFVVTCVAMNNMQKLAQVLRVQSLVFSRDHNGCEEIEDTNAPLVAEFSSRGANIIVPEILKPDISAPGVDILAACSAAVSPSVGALDKRSVKYDFVSWTSMACPHVTGAAGDVKSFHPDWSPFTIKSTLMNTGWPMNDTQRFASGSGHLNPGQAADPGLV
ncbi:hypothetical protein FNV43_RR05622 [Rhamnella rubrinervis]|uniref:Peptidase S8/S53 domain-containing protein n=1 Tax=Rhamnella rubrinervis TaxID=2594499 RepID=A0A8K0HPD8_9ROSA|nr:hypothetical protein FNV43_RR05622 [Rhamnella rubrinervis]